MNTLLQLESVRPKKYSYGVKQVVILPSPKQKKDLTDYQYGKDIDEKVVKMAVGLAEKLAISMIREALSVNTDTMVNKIVSELTEKIVAAIPEQRTVIQQVVSEESTRLKSELSEFAFEGAEISIDRSKGLKLHGKTGKTSSSEESTDSVLDLLDNLS